MWLIDRSQPAARARSAACWRLFVYSALAAPARFRLPLKNTLEAAFNMPNIPIQEWPIELCPEFEAWLDGLEDDALRLEILSHAKALQRLGPGTGRPLVDTLKGSKHANMKELRMQYAGEPWRIMFAFDPRRIGIVLLGGSKAGKPDWYDENIPVADARYDAHLERLAEDAKPKLAPAGKGKGKSKGKRK